MLQIVIPKNEIYDEINNEFYTISGCTLHLEHSLVAISKWESKWHKPFLSDKEKRTDEEMLDYIQCMITDENIDPLVLSFLTEKNVDEIKEYINNPMTATTFPKETTKTLNKEPQTAETIYYQMIAHQIPVEFQHWHITRLITLIRVCNIKNQPPKKTNKKDILRENHELNEMRKKQLHTKG